MLLAVFTGAAFCTALVLIWLVRWAYKDDGRLGQFSIASLLFSTLLVSIYFGIVRWIVVSSEVHEIRMPTEGAWRFVFVAVLCLLAHSCFTCEALVSLSSAARRRSWCAWSMVR